MPQPFLLSRLLLQFDSEDDELIQELSAMTLSTDGSLWVASDEFLTLERLSPIEPHVYGNHQQFEIANYIDLFNSEDEIDIEGMDYVEPYLWFTGSHSKKRGKTKGKKPEKDINNLAEVKTDLNRYLIARIPVFQGEPLKSCSHPTDPERTVSAAAVQTTETSNQLIEVLQGDPHLGPFIEMDIPSKENGLDIEGLAVCGDKLFLGLRGPVLRGWAIILEIEVQDDEPGVLTLKEIGENGEKYKKHFVNLNGLGIRELCLRGEHLIILAGPTMDLEGAMQVFQLKNILDHSGNTLWDQSADTLELLFNLPFTIGSDHAEGLALLPCLGQAEALAIIYDSPNSNRRVQPHSILADVFRLD
ncbi:DUF3616 domain-containing protein [Acaryochloris sp. CCMEE 5410]|uniref:DUF3616 domain-containing protein n=1 Tax=Acaryochloris sp. CCMEE 5410 TaxID=310037 RepID=UPI0002484A91|nr:DUF3616 domain-containing protein [Acaryochloris sp. CCMEE 5410]KAI9129116.1 DUF3616 domain-containing protein [Acaryochloris sp. CCMEE 5410]